MKAWAMRGMVESTNNEGNVSKFGHVTSKYTLARFMKPQIIASICIKREIFVDVNTLRASCPHSMKSACNRCISRGAWSDWSTIRDNFSPVL